MLSIWIDTGNNNSSHVTVILTKHVQHILMYCSLPCCTIIIYLQSVVIHFVSYSISTSVFKHFSLRSGLTNLINTILSNVCTVFQLRSFLCLSIDWWFIFVYPVPVSGPFSHTAFLSLFTVVQLDDIQEENGKLFDNMLPTYCRVKATQPLKIVLLESFRLNSRKIIQMCCGYQLKYPKQNQCNRPHVYDYVCVLISLVNTLTLKVQMEIESDSIKLTFLPWRTLTGSSESCDFLCTHLSLKHDRRRYFKT